MPLKPSRRKALYYIACALILLTTWSIFSSTKKLNNHLTGTPSPRSSTQQEKYHSDSQLSTHSSRKQRPYIDTRARLLSLYQRYPDLAIELPEPTPELDQQLRDLFPDEIRDQISAEASKLEPMLLGESEWDEALALAFLETHHDRLQKLLEIIPQKNTYRELMFDLSRAPLRLLYTSYAIELEFGNIENAQSIYSGLVNYTKTTSNTDLLNSTIAVASSVQISKLHQLAYNLHPELIHKNTLILPLLTNFHETIQGEFASGISLLHNFSTLHNGETVLSASELLNTDSIQDEDYITLYRAEELFAEIYTQQFHFIDKFNARLVLPSEENFEKEWKNFFTSPAQNPVEELLTHALTTGVTEMMSALPKANYLLDTQRTAIQIAESQRLGTPWTTPLPTNPFTGEPAIWDQQTNQILTGLEDKDATIPIPTAP